MRAVRLPHENQRGVALVLALLSLVVLSALSLAFFMSLSAGRRNASYDAQATKALSAAEAGIGEAMERIRRLDVPNNSNPKSVAQIFLTPAGSVPSVGADTVALATQQPTSNWLTYSSATRGPEVLTVAYKTDPARTVIYKYDVTKTPSVNTASGQPIYVITATGRFGSAKRTVIAEVANRQPPVNIKGAVVGVKKVDFKGANGNGYDHRADTPTGTGDNGSRALAWETTSAPKPAIYSEDKAKYDGILQGSPKVVDDQPDAYTGVWEVLNMTQAEFDNWIGEPNGDKKQGNPRGITYVDRDGSTPHDGKGKFEWKGGFNGDGIIYANGDLKIKGDFTFRGLIYVNGKFEVDGASWILGSIIAKEIKIKGKKGMERAVLRSDDSVALNIAKYGGQFATLSWREVRN